MSEDTVTTYSMRKLVPKLTLKERIFGRDLTRIDITYYSIVLLVGIQTTRIRLLSDRGSLVVVEDSDYRLRDAQSGGAKWVKLEEPKKIIPNDLAAKILELKKTKDEARYAIQNALCIPLSKITTE